MSAASRRARAPRRWTRRRSSRGCYRCWTGSRDGYPCPSLSTQPSLQWLAAGAAAVNDIHGLRAAPELATIAAERNAALIVMANLRGVVYQDVMQAVCAQLRHSCAVAAAAGVPAERVIIDPGFGFGPPPQDNLAMVRRLPELQQLSRPLLLGPSRKSTIGRVLGLPPAERLEGTLALVTLAVAGGADMVRVHDVRAVARATRMADAAVRGRLPEGAA